MVVQNDHQSNFGTANSNQIQSGSTSNSSTNNSGSHVQGVSTNSGCHIQGVQSNPGCHDRVLKYQHHFDFSFDQEDEEAVIPWPNTFNMRQVTLCNLAGGISLRSMVQRTHTPRTRSRCVMSAGKSLDVLRQNLQASINRDIDAVIQTYLKKFFYPAVRNIRRNLGRSSVTTESLREVARSILDEAKLFYAASGKLASPGNPGASPASEDEAGAPEVPLVISSRKRKVIDSDEQNKRRRLEAPSIVPLHKLDPLRIDSSSLFMLASKAQKVLGLRSERVSVRLPAELFRYRTDKDDRDWMTHRKLLRATSSSGSVNLVVVEDVRELATRDEYKSNAPPLSSLSGFQVPEVLLIKIQNSMAELRSRDSRYKVTLPDPVTVGFESPNSDSSCSSLSNLLNISTRVQSKSNTHPEECEAHESPARRTSPSHIRPHVSNLGTPETMNSPHGKSLSTADPPISQTIDYQIHHSMSQAQNVNFSSKTMSHSGTAPNHTMSHSMASPNQTMPHSMSSEDHTMSHSMPSEEHTMSHSMPSEDHTVSHSMTSPDHTMFHNMTSPNHTMSHYMESPNHTMPHNIPSEDHTLSHSMTSPNHTMSQNRESPNHTMSHRMASPNHTMSHSMSSPDHTISHTMTSPDHTISHTMTSPDHTISHTMTSPDDSMSSWVEVASCNSSLAESHSTLTALLSSQTRLTSQ